MRDLCGQIRCIEGDGNVNGVESAYVYVSVHQWTRSSNQEDAVKSRTNKRGEVDNNWDYD